MILSLIINNTIHIIKSLNSKSDTTGLGEFFGNITVIERNDISRVNLISKTMYSISSGYIPDYLIGHIDVTSNNNDRLGCANKLPRLHYISTSNRAFTNEHSNTVFCYWLQTKKLLLCNRKFGFIFREMQKKTNFAIN